MGKIPSFFITGTQRSGTTLLCKMLNTHPSLQMLNEVFTPHELDTMFFSSKNTDLGIALFEAVHQKGLHITKALWGIKHPYFTYRLENLFQCFPDVKMVMTLRDGRAVGNSYLKTKWGIANIYYGAKIWQEEVERQARCIEQYPERCHLVKYESLLEDAEGELKKICRFLGIRYVQDMLDYHKQLPDYEENKSNVNTKKPLDRQIMTKWRTQLTPFQINVFETIAGETMEKYEYELIGRTIKISPTLKIWYWIHQKIVGEIQLQYQWRFKGILRQYLRK